MDEVSGSRIDEVAGVALTDLGGMPPTPNNVVGVDAVPGMYGNALRYYNKVGGVFQHPIGYNLGILPSMATSGKGLSMFGWLKIVSYGPAPGSGFGMSGPWGYLEVLFESASQYIRFNVGTYGTAAIALPVGSWFFFHVFYEATLGGRCGFSVNNGAPVYGATALGILGPSHVTQVTFNTIGNFGVCNEWMVDEVGLTLDDKLCDSDAAYLYNAGAGRTWPIVLP